jgi:hypothetical protein
VTQNAGIKALRDMQRTFAEWAEQGHPNMMNVGQFGEDIIAALHPTWQRASRGTEGYDFIDDDGQRVQVKTWGTEGRSHDNVKNSADRLIRVRLHADGWDIMTDIDVRPYFASGLEMIPFNRRGQPMKSYALRLAA